MKEILGGRLGSLQAAERLRVRPSVPLGAIDFCSNDYLDLGSHAVEEEACGEDQTGSAVVTHSGARGSRLVVGDHHSHGAVESALSAFLGYEATLLFASGYAANLGAVSSLAMDGDLVVSDALNHASIIDGCQLSKAEILVVPHLGYQAARAKLLEHARTNPESARWIVCESYFSMDADTPDFHALRALCDETDAFSIVDDAHALGVFGEGRGMCSAHGFRPDVLVGTFGKALGNAGAFVSGSEEVIAWLWNRARSFVFSTGISPLVAASVLRALDWIPSEEASRRRQQLLSNAELFRSLVREKTSLRDAGVHAIGSGPIVPIVGFSDPVEAARVLQAAGYWVQAIRPPTVPSSRLRVTMRAGHTEAELRGFVNSLAP